MSHLLQSMDAAQDMGVMSPPEPSNLPDDMPSLVTESSSATWNSQPQIDDVDEDEDSHEGDEPPELYSGSGDEGDDETDDEESFDGQFEDIGNEDNAKGADSMASDDDELPGLIGTESDSSDDLAPTTTTRAGTQQTRPVATAAPAARPAKQQQPASASEIKKGFFNSDKQKVRKPAARSEAPVSTAYSNVGVGSVEEGPAALLGNQQRTRAPAPYGGVSGMREEGPEALRRSRAAQGAPAPGAAAQGSNARPELSSDDDALPAMEDGEEEEEMPSLVCEGTDSSDVEFGHTSTKAKKDKDSGAKRAEQRQRTSLNRRQEAEQQQQQPPRPAPEPVPPKKDKAKRERTTKASAAPTASRPADEARAALDPSLILEYNKQQAKERDELRRKMGFVGEDSNKPATDYALGQCCLRPGCGVPDKCREPAFTVLESHKRVHINCSRGCRMVLHYDCWRRYSDALEGLLGPDKFDRQFKKSHAQDKVKLHHCFTDCCDGYITRAYAYQGPELPGVTPAYHYKYYEMDEQARGYMESAYRKAKEAKWMEAYEANLDVLRKAPKKGADQLHKKARAEGAAPGGKDKKAKDGKDATAGAILSAAGVSVPGAAKKQLEAAQQAQAPAPAAPKGISIMNRARFDVRAEEAFLEDEPYMARSVPDDAVLMPLQRAADQEQQQQDKADKEREAQQQDKARSQGSTPLPQEEEPAAGEDAAAATGAGPSTAAQQQQPAEEDAPAPAAAAAATVPAGGKKKKAKGVTLHWDQFAAVNASGAGAGPSGEADAEAPLAVEDIGGRPYAPPKQRHLRGDEWPQPAASGQWAQPVGVAPRVLKPYDFPTLELAAEVGRRGEAVEALRDFKMAALNNLRLSANVGGMSPHLLLECVDFRSYDDDELVVQQHLCSLMSAYGKVLQATAFKQQSAVAITMLLEDDAARVHVLMANKPFGKRKLQVSFLLEHPTHDVLERNMPPEALSLLDGEHAAAATARFAGLPGAGSSAPAAPFTATPAALPAPQSSPPAPARPARAPMYIDPATGLLPLPAPRPKKVLEIRDPSLPKAPAGAPATSSAAEPAAELAYGSGPGPSAPPPPPPLPKLNFAAPEFKLPAKRTDSPAPATSRTGDAPAAAPPEAAPAAAAPAPVAAAEPASASSGLDSQPPAEQSTDGVVPSAAAEEKEPAQAQPEVNPVAAIAAKMARAASAASIVSAQGPAAAAPAPVAAATTAPAAPASSEAAPAEATPPPAPPAAPAQVDAPTAASSVAAPALAAPALAPAPAAPTAAPAATPAAAVATAVLVAPPLAPAAPTAAPAAATATALVSAPPAAAAAAAAPAVAAVPLAPPAPAAPAAAAAGTVPVLRLAAPAGGMPAAGPSAAPGAAPVSSRTGEQHGRGAAGGHAAAGGAGGNALMAMAMGASQAKQLAAAAGRGIGALVQQQPNNNGAVNKDFWMSFDAVQLTVCNRATAAAYTVNSKFRLQSSFFVDPERVGRVERTALLVYNMETFELLGLWSAVENLGQYIDWARVHPYPLTMALARYQASQANEIFALPPATYPQKCVGEDARTVLRTFGNEAVPAGAADPLVAAAAAVAAAAPAAAPAQAAPAAAAQQPAAAAPAANVPLAPAATPGYLPPYLMYRPPGGGAPAAPAAAAGAAPAEPPLQAAAPSTNTRQAALNALPFMNLAFARAATPAAGQAAAPTVAAAGPAIAAPATAATAAATPPTAAAAPAARPLVMRPPAAVPIAGPALQPAAVAVPLAAPAQQQPAAPATLVLAPHAAAALAGAGAAAPAAAQPPAAQQAPTAAAPVAAQPPAAQQAPAAAAPPIKKPPPHLACCLCGNYSFGYITTDCKHQCPCLVCCPTADEVPKKYPRCLKCNNKITAKKLYKVHM